MRDDIKKEWVTKLRSGVPQIRGRLGRGDGRCAGGVLCDIAVEHGVATREVNPDSGIVVYDGAGIISIPRHIQEWANLSQGDVHLVEILNDRGNTFDDIANFIDQYL